MSKPACMTPGEYVLWSQANAAITNRRARATSACFDCPVAFSRAMLAEGCCDGQPLFPMRTGRPTLEDTPQRARWRLAAQRKRDRERTAWDNTGVGSSDEPNRIADGTRVSATTRGAGVFASHEVVAR